MNNQPVRFSGEVGCRLCLDCHSPLVGNEIEIGYCAGCAETHQPLPNPSADEEVEHGIINANARWVSNQHVVDYEIAFDREQELLAELIQLRQQHNAEREALQQVIPEGYRVAKDSLVDRVRLMVDGLHAYSAELQQLRASLAERELGLTELGNELFDCKAQIKERDDKLASVQAELATAQAEIPKRLEKFIVARIQAALGEIIQVSDRARRDPRMKGHHCDLRKALDSIYDRANLNAENLAACWKQFSDHELSQLDSLRSQLQTAMEERDEWKKRANLLNEHNQHWVAKIREQKAQLDAVNSRLEERDGIVREGREVVRKRDEKIDLLQREHDHQKNRAIELEGFLNETEQERVKFLNERNEANSRLEEVEKAAGLMFETVDARRSPDALQDRADLLIKRGWTPIPFTPEGAPEGFTAKITHPYQKWQKLYHMNKITEQALKIELREDTDNLRALLSRISTSRETENKT